MDPEPPDWLHASLWLLVVPLLVRVVGARRASKVASDSGGPASGDWDPRVDTALLLACALAGAVSLTWAFAPLYLIEFPISASDFSDYCTAVANVREGQFQGFPIQRSVTAAMLPGLLAGSQGVLGGLVWTAIGSTAVLCGAVFLHGRALHGRTAGVAGVVIAATFPPLVLLSRSVNFYPEVTAICALAMAFGTATLRFSGWLWWLGAGGVASVALLIDVRGLLWAAPALAVALVSAVVRGRGHVGRVSRVLATLVPLGIAWGLAPFAWSGVSSLQDQSFHYLEDAVRLVGLPTMGIGAPSPAQSYTFGVDPVSHIPDAVSYLRALDEARPASLVHRASYTGIGRAAVLWRVPVLVCCALAALSLWRRPGLLFGGALLLVPALLSLRTALNMLPQPRQVTAGSVALTVVAGVAFAALLGGALPRVDVRGRGSTVRVVVGLALLALATHGYVPSWLSPSAAWRAGPMGEMEPRMSLGKLARGERTDLSKPCARALEADKKRGLPACPAIVGECGEPP